MCILVLDYGSFQFGTCEEQTCWGASALIFAQFWQQYCGTAGERREGFVTHPDSDVVFGDPAWHRHQIAFLKACSRSIVCVGDGSYAALEWCNNGRLYGFRTSDIDVITVGALVLSVFCARNGTLWCLEEKRSGSPEWGTHCETAHGRHTRHACGQEWYCCADCPLTWCRCPWPMFCVVQCLFGVALCDTWVGRWPPGSVT